MRYIRSSIFVLIGASCMILSQSCSTCSRHQTIENMIVDLNWADFSADSAYVNMGREVLYALPNPIKVSMLIKKWGVGFQPSLLHDPAKASSYLTKKNRAVNFGIYITDLTTAGLYEQTQTVLKYKQALLQLVEGLGLEAAVDQKMMKQLEDNINNRNEVLRIISETYASCTEFLQEEDLHLYALAMLSGGWIEGMYIAASTIDQKSDDLLKQLIVDNKPTFDLLWQALSDLENVPEDAVTLLSQMSDLATLMNVATNNATPEMTVKVKNQILLLRSNFVKE